MAMTNDERVISFNVPGPVRAKARPALSGRRYYKDKATVAYEDLVKLAAAKALEDAPRFEGAVAVQIRVSLEPAPSRRPSARRQMIGGFVSATQRPDLDNVIKSVLDGCNGVVFRDDVFVVELSATKYYAEQPGLSVTITSSGPVEPT
jgi:Holliday junction resolvase RusA-like endonuclease